MISEKMDARPRPDIEAVMAECQPHTKEFYESDKVLYDADLESEIQNLRRVDGKVMVTDGPFTESKELIGKAEDIDEAIPTTQ
jgi:hypothetical protein